MRSNDDRERTVSRLNVALGQRDSAVEPSHRHTRQAVDSVADRSASSTADPDWLVPPVDRGTTALSAFLPPRWRGARVDPGRRGAVALAGAGLVVVTIAVIAVFGDAPVPAPVPPLPVVSAGAPGTSTDVAPELPGDTSDSASTIGAEVVVSVVGLVARPGLVRLQPGSRIADALAGAGGPLADSDLLALNMAARVADGDQIVVGVVPVAAPPPVSSATSGGGAGGTTAQVGTVGVAGVGTVDLNAATVTELDALPGVGPVTAAAIVGWRDINGTFASVDQLAEVDGIGPGRLTKIRELVHVG